MYACEIDNTMYDFTWPPQLNAESQGRAVGLAVFLVAEEHGRCGTELTDGFTMLGVIRGNTRRQGLERFKAVSDSFH